MRVPLNVGLWFNTFWSIDLMDLHFPEDPNKRRCCTDRVSSVNTGFCHDHGYA